jgi:glutathione S-transferase
MSLTGIVLPSDYGYVLFAAASTYFVNFYHIILTSSARKASGIIYPAAYASNEQAEKDPKAYAFNCGTFLPRHHETRRRSM